MSESRPPEPAPAVGAAELEGLGTLTVRCRGLARCRVAVWYDEVKLGTAAPDRDVVAPLQPGWRVITLQMDGTREGHRFEVRPGDDITFDCLRGNDGEGWSIRQIAAAGLLGHTPWSVTLHQGNRAGQRPEPAPPEPIGRYSPLLGVQTARIPVVRGAPRIVALVCLLWLLVRMGLGPAQLIPGPWILDVASFVAPALVFLLCVHPRMHRRRPSDE